MGFGADLEEGQAPAGESEFRAGASRRGTTRADHRSRSSYVHSDQREAAAEQRWPPGRNEPCWCGSERKYKRCCGSLPAGAEVEAAA